MKSFLLLSIATSLFLLSSPACSAQNERPPVPKFSAAQAIEKVTKFVHDQEKDSDPGTFIISVVYGSPDKLHLTMTDNNENAFVDDAEKEPSWFVTYWTYPHTGRRIYRLKNNGEVTPLTSLSS